jgi:hypothetical protein
MTALPNTHPTGTPVDFPPELQPLKADIDNVIASIASRYTDISCPQLNYPDLVAEGNLKLAELIHKGFVGRLPGNPNPTRTEWFKFFKTVVNNHIKGLVHRYRGTIKRTGHRLPTKEERLDPLRESNKPVELSIDDPEAHLQLGEPEELSTLHELEEKELIEHVKSALTPLEKLVFDQLLSPNEEAWFWAAYRSFHGHVKTEAIKVHIKDIDKARGLGMDLDLFLTVQRSIQQKFMSMQNEKVDVRYNAALTTLCQVFNLQVPDSLKFERDTIARMFTMAARRESEKVTGDIAELLRVVGAKSPDTTTQFETCFGVLYDKSSPRCLSCGVKEACQQEAATHGIDGTISYSPRLMGSKIIRTPILTDNKANFKVSQLQASQVKQASPQAAPNDARRAERDDEIDAFLLENFVRRPSKENIYLDYKEASSIARYIFWYERRERLKLRFCNPSENLKRRLVRVKNGFYLPDHISAEEAIKLINLHAKERLLK